MAFKSHIAIVTALWIYLYIRTTHPTIDSIIEHVVPPVLRLGVWQGRARRNLTKLDSIY